MASLNSLASRCSPATRSRTRLRSPGPTSGAGHSDPSTRSAQPRMAASTATQPRRRSATACRASTNGSRSRPVLSPTGPAPPRTPASPPMAQRRSDHLVARAIRLPSSATGPATSSASNSVRPFRPIVDYEGVKIQDLLPPGYRYIAGLRGHEVASRSTPSAGTTGHGVGRRLSPSPSGTTATSVHDGNTFRWVIAAEFTDNNAGAANDINANLQKLVHNNNGGLVFQMRDQAAAEWTEPQVRLAKGVDHVNTAGVERRRLRRLAQRLRHTRRGRGRRRRRLPRRRVEHRQHRCARNRSAGSSPGRLRLCRHHPRSRRVHL